MFTLSEAFAKVFVSRNQPVITKKALGAMMLHAYRDREIEGMTLRVRTQHPGARDVSQAIRRLERDRIIRADPDFGASVYRIVEAVDQTAEAACSTADPFCYLSHATALQRYGFSDRNPLALTFTSPAQSLLKQWREEALKGSTGVEREEILARHERVAFPEDIRGQQVRRIQSLRYGEWVRIEGPARLATVGQTFLDTLLEPAFCGGMAFVIEVWKREARRYAPEIAAAVDRCRVPIAKVRAGYLLEDVVGIRAPSIDSWVAFAQRGSSRRLDPERPFESRHSPRWMLSLNV